MRKQSFKRTEPVVPRRGFLLLVVVGILAVLLTICVGFLSYSRGEVQAVASQRDKSDGLDLVHSAIDWTLANISKDHMSSSGAWDTTTPVAFSNDNFTWWYKPSEPGLTALLTNWWPAGPYNGVPPSVSTKTETQYTYLPQDFFPGGGVRGRFTVQVLDTNALININDWNEDCMPTQAQMAHMMMDAYGENQGEFFRRTRDMNYGPYQINWWNIPLWAAPIRYQEAWRVATHSQRFINWTLWNFENVRNLASYNWVTGNTSWFTLFGADYSCLHTSMQSDGVPQSFGPNLPTLSYRGSNGFAPTENRSAYPGSWITHSGGTNWLGGYNSANFCMTLQPWYMSGFACQASVDPNTGRSPVNVNTCFNSGECLPCMWDQKVPTYTMEGVWNIESLRRLIKVGYFKSPTTGTPKNAQTDWPTLDIFERMKIEQLKTKLAYQYQETLCRYFTGTYAHVSNFRLWDAIDYHDIHTYPQAFPLATSSPPTHYCTVTDYSSPRFPVSLSTFRKNVHDDLLAMCTNNRNPRFNPSGFVPAIRPAYPDGIPQYGPDRTDGTVNFDGLDTPEIAPGKLDTRVAAASYDNLYPGKPPDISDFGKKNTQTQMANGNAFSGYQIDTTYLPNPANAKQQTDPLAGCQAYRVGDNTDSGGSQVAYSDPGFPKTMIYPDGDPIYEMYVLQVGRQEDVDDKYNIDPSYYYNPPPSGTPNYTPDYSKTPCPNFPNWSPNAGGKSIPPTYGWPQIYRTSTADNNDNSPAQVQKPPLTAPRATYYPFSRMMINSGYGDIWNFSQWWSNQNPGPGVSNPKAVNFSWSTNPINGNNLYGYWADNPNLPEVSSFLNGNYFPYDGNQRVDAADHYGNYQNVSAKGRDVFSSTNSAIKPGTTVTFLHGDVQATVNPYKTPFQNGSSYPYINTGAPYNAPPYDTKIIGGTTYLVNCMPADHWIPTGPWLDFMGKGWLANPDPNPNALADNMWQNDFQNTEASGNFTNGRGPADTNNNVPWRQLCFTPDSFSTELTTTSNTFILIINAELVDAASVAANPTNPALQRRLWWNQWGAVVELSAGMESAITTPADLAKNPIYNAPNNPEVNYYGNERPMLRKTASSDPVFKNGGNTPLAPNTAFYDPINSMDTNCATLVSRIMDCGAQVGQPSYDRVQNQFGSRSDNDQRNLPMSGPPDPEHSNYTTVMDWKADIHNVPPATSGNFQTRSSVPTNGRAADVIYNGANQAQKRVLIRSIWCLNDAVRR